jgi:uncharacterized membrane protein YesL
MNDLTQKGNPILFWFTKVGDFFCLSMFWLLLCLPVLTIVPASIALYDSVAHCIWGEEDGSIRRFFRTLKREILKGILINVFWLVIGFILFSGYRILYIVGQENSTMAAYSLVYLFTMLIPLGIFAWMIPVQSRFEHTFGSLHRAAAVYAIAHLPSTVMILLLLIAAVVLLLFFPVLILLLPAITVTVQSWFIERAFKQHMPQED